MMMMSSNIMEIALYSDGLTCPGRVCTILVGTATANSTALKLFIFFSVVGPPVHTVFVFVSYCIVVVLL